VKKPWFLSNGGMRTMVYVCLGLAAVMVVPAAQQINEDHTRLVSVLDPANLSYCELASCSYIEELGVEVISPATYIEGEFGTEVMVQVVNIDRLVGEREVWAELRTSSGELVEGMRGLMTLSDQGPQFITFFFTGTPAEIQRLDFTLAY
jgi:hypothetical protein